MKNLITLFFTCLIVLSFTSVSAQQYADAEFKNKKRSAFYDYNENKLSGTDTIPGFETQEEKLVISGTIYKSDGVTPAKDVILFICQADEYGNYNSKKVNGKRVPTHRGWIKTDADGKYTFYTFVPGTYWPSREIMQIRAAVKVPGEDEAFALDHYIFDHDPLLRKSCRKKIEKKGLNNILKLEKKDKVFIGKRDIILPQNSTSI